MKPSLNHVQFVSVKSNISESEIQNNIFYVQRDDNETRISLDDRVLLELIRKSFQNDQDKRWKAPLQLRKLR